MICNTEVKFEYSRAYPLIMTSILHTYRTGSIGMRGYYVTTEGPRLCYALRNGDFGSLAASCADEGV